MTAAARARPVEASLFQAEPIVSRLRRGADRLRRADAGERSRRLGRLLDALRAEESAIQSALAKDLERAPVDATAELLLVRSEIAFADAHLAEWMAPRSVPTGLMSRGTTAWVQPQPKGAVLVIAPWNAPFACSLVPLVSALAAGNSVCLKPSELAPQSARLLAHLCGRVFDPTEVVVVEGGAEEARALVAQPFDHIYFTGGGAIGREVLVAAAENLTPVTLELGGKNPVIVDRTADIPDAAKKIAWGRFANAGQACVAPDHVYVHRDRYRDFVAWTARAVREQCDPEGTGVVPSSCPGRIAHRRHFDRLAAMLDDAVERGATVEIGGGRDPDALRIAPTVLSGVDRAMAVMQEEIFGPILPVLPYDDEDALLGSLRAQPVPLSLYVFSRDDDAIARLLRETRAGNTAVNHVMIQAGVNPHLPFGGEKESGSGRAVGRAGFDTFSSLRSVVRQPLGWRDFSWLSLPPTKAIYRRMVHALFHSDAV